MTDYKPASYRYSWYILNALRFHINKMREDLKKIKEFQKTAEGVMAESLDGAHDHLEHAIKDYNRAYEELQKEYNINVRTKNYNKQPRFE